MSVIRVHFRAISQEYVTELNYWTANKTWPQEHINNFPNKEATWVHPLRLHISQIANLEDNEIQCDKINIEFKCGVYSLKTISDMLIHNLGHILDIKVGEGDHMFKGSLNIKSKTSQSYRVQITKQLAFLLGIINFYELYSDHNYYVAILISDIDLILKVDLAVHLTCLKLTTSGFYDNKDFVLGDICFSGSELEVLLTKNNSVISKSINSQNTHLWPIQRTDLANSSIRLETFCGANLKIKFAEFVADFERKVT